MQFQLNISGLHFLQLKTHLFSGDGKESVAVALCGRAIGDDIHKLSIYKLVLIPNEECSIREEDYIQWPTDRILPLLIEANKRNMAILKIHCHPGGYEDFSNTDNKSDAELFTSVFGWVDSDYCHASAIMLPDGRIFGRVFDVNLETKPFSKVIIAGDCIKIWRGNKLETNLRNGFAKRTIQAFGEGTFSILKSMKIAVVGCSGTGSVVIEQLYRLGVGELVLVDPDKVEEKNLNRILNTKYDDIGKSKVDVIINQIKSSGFETKVSGYNCNLYDDLNCLKKIAECDVLFGCVDSIDGRDLLNVIATFYLIPYFDLGVKLEADGLGGIKQIVGSCHYIQPGYSSLKSRNVYDGEDLKASGLLRRFPNEYNDLVKNSYIKNINVDRPAVISVNMQIASLAINDFLNRIHEFKLDDPENFAQSTIDISAGYMINRSESEFKVDEYLLKRLGMGDVKPFIQNIDFQSI